LSELKSSLGAPVNSDPSKRKLEPADAFPEGFVGSCFPRVLLFPTLTGEPASRTEKLTLGEAMALLIRQCPWASYDEATAREHLRVLGLLSKQSVSYLLHAGRDLIEDSSSAPELLKAACLEQ
jgi:hypothetical protein